MSKRERETPVPSAEVAGSEPAALDPVTDSVLAAAVARLNIPTIGQFLFGVSDVAADQKERIKRAAEAYGLGTPEFEAWLDRWVDNAFNSTARLVLVGRIKDDVRALLAAGRGPVEHSPVDLA